MNSMGPEVILLGLQALPGQSWHAGRIARQDEGARGWKKKVLISRVTWEHAKCKQTESFSLGSSVQERSCAERQCKD